MHYVPETRHQRLHRVYRELDEGSFSQRQWEHVQNRRCTSCMQIKTLLCTKCKLTKSLDAFSTCQTQTPLKMKNAAKRRCNACLEEFELEVRKSLGRNHWSVEAAAIRSSFAARPSGEQRTFHHWTTCLEAAHVVFHCNSGAWNWWPLSALSLNHSDGILEFWRRQPQDPRSRFGRREGTAGFNTGWFALKLSHGDIVELCTGQVS